MQERMTIEKWYGTAVRIPLNYDDYAYTFVTSFTGLVNSILEDNYGSRIKMRFMVGGTAAADHENDTIYVNYDFLRGNFTSMGVPGELRFSIAMTAVLGIVIHEASHFAFTPAKFLETCQQRVFNHCKANSIGFDPRLAADLGNIVEDIFIEAEADRRVPSISWMVNQLNELMFPSTSETRILGAVASTFSAPRTLPEAMPLFNLALLAKTRSSVKTTPFCTTIFEAARTATRMVDVEDRYALTVKLYDMIFRHVPTVDSALIDSSLKGLEGKLSREATNTDKSVRSTIEGLPVNTLNKKLEDNEDNKMSIERVESLGNNGPSNKVMVIKEEVVKDRGKGTMKPDSRYFDLAEVARQRATVNKPYGTAQVRGHTIRRLSRIATDSKIFAEPVTMNDYKPMQVTILVDMSGSMASRTSTTNPRPRISAALEAAAGAAQGLAAGRCEVAIYGHTSDMDGVDMVIYTIKSFSDPISSVPGRTFEAMGKKRSQNADGHAVKFVARKMKSTSKRRVLIVISDGLPSGNIYTGGFEHGVKHTQDVVKQLRSSGIDVYSISISGDAVEGNNRIYGRQFNVANHDPNVISELVRQLITK